MPIKDERAGFTVRLGHYEIKRLLLACRTVRKISKRLMDIVLKDLVGPECYVFVDDSVVSAKSAE